MIVVPYFKNTKTCLHVFRLYNNAFLQSTQAIKQIVHGTENFIRVYCTVTVYLCAALRC